jgi:penicillin-binding protein 2
MNGPETRRPPITPQLAMRVAVLGGAAFVLFAIIFFRLWFLQVLSGPDYVAQATDNRVRRTPIEAPRGDIVDRNGTLLVRTREAPVVQIEPASLPRVITTMADEYRKALAAAEGRRLAAGAQLRALERDMRDEDRKLTPEERRERRALARASRRAETPDIPPVPAEVKPLFRRLGKLVDLPTRDVHERVVQGIADAPYANVTVRVDVPRAAFNYLKERQEMFPGVTAAKLYLREYPHDELGAQLFGTLREISPKELEKEDYRGVNQGERIGKDGIEETYDRYLRGEPGFTRYVINALGERDERKPMSRKDPVQGQRLRLTLDLDLQETADRAMERAIQAAITNGNPAKAGAYVALDPRNGEVLALGSYPSFDANLFAKPLSQETFDALNSEENGAPLFNRAIAAAYPTGSTFKVITALAALESRTITTDTPIFDDGLFKLGPQEFRNAKNARFGPLSLRRALQVSSDVFFYTLGAQMNAQGPVIQRWARRLGLGRPTGIDIPGEFDGLVPDAAWRNEGYDRYGKCVKRNKLSPQTFAALTTCGGIERPWSAGDNVNLSVGQGDLQATPLQMAVAYSAVFNGGRVVRPHLGMAVEDGQGRLVEEVEVTDRRQVKFDPLHGQAIMDGLRAAAMEPGGTSADVFSGFGRGQYTVLGKTGTVERPGQPDQSWYAAIVPHDTRPIAVVVTVEKGGFGAETAAPAARMILSRWFNLRDNEFHVGVSATR